MHFSAQDIVLILGALGVFVSGPLVLLVREMRRNTTATEENTADRARLALTGTTAVASNKVASEVVPAAPPPIPVTVVPEVVDGQR